MLGLQNVTKVGIAEMNIVQAPHSIRTSGLGSCVGVVIYDNSAKIAGMVHVMLPESSLARTSTFNSCKYADTGVDHLLETLLLKGARLYQLKAKIAGGAQMFQFTSKSSDMMRIGPRNVEAVKARLEANNIPLIGEDCGGNSGRTIEFYPESGKLMIKTVNKGIRYI
ncbi:chemotaxis protein CheD [Sutcliffiella halmapala]|uniref:chemotaxis protein CheD n=1 Tax=Sutcliffiella halmapala TaxID=79882 RepID=UPI001116944F|nr:chemotaxis protein CheD [Sutcliffiella halmapala]